MATNTEKLNYILSNPDLRENAEAAGLTQSEMIEMADWHWNNHGKNEGRENTVDKITNSSGYTEKLGSHHYQGRDVVDVLQASVRAADPSEMWEAREEISPAWNLDQYTAEGWNLDPDNPYRTGILGDTIKVDTGVGQLWSEGDERFLQDRYEDAAIANDFPADWVKEDGSWEGPDELAGYWSDVTNAVRNEAGDLRAIRDRPSTGWAGTDVLDVGDRWSGNVRTDGTNTTSRVESGAAGSENLLAYRPWTKNYWSEYIPKDSQGLLYMDKPQREYGISYLPGEHRDPGGWHNWVMGGHKGQPPGGGWRTQPSTYKVGVQRPGFPSYFDKGSKVPWKFTSPGSLPGKPRYNIDFSPWAASSMNLTPAQGTGWQGFLSDLAQTPTIDTTTKTLLGV